MVYFDRIWIFFEGHFSWFCWSFEWPKFTLRVKKCCYVESANEKKLFSVPVDEVKLCVNCGIPWSCAWFRALCALGSAVGMFRVLSLGTGGRHWSPLVVAARILCVVPNCVSCGGDKVLAEVLLAEIMIVGDEALGLSAFMGWCFLCGAVDLVLWRPTQISPLQELLGW